jgi:predicted aspartyl protease
MASADLPWDPFDPYDPGPCIDVQVMNSRDVIDAGRAVGLEYPGPVTMRALLDTGASITVISKQFAEYCKLRQTSAGSEITAIGAVHRCGEHAGGISFPNTNLRPLDPIRIVSAVFAKERYYSCLIGRDILRNWNVTFDGRAKRVRIVERY